MIFLQTTTLNFRKGTFKTLTNVMSKNVSEANWKVRPESGTSYVSFFILYFIIKKGISDRPTIKTFNREKYHESRMDTVINENLGTTLPSRWSLFSFSLVKACCWTMADPGDIGD